MSAINPNETAKVWQATRPEPAVHLYLAGVDGELAGLVDARVGGYPVQFNVVPITDWIDPNDLNSAVGAVIQVAADVPASLKRFEKLLAVAEQPLIAAAYEPPLSLVRTLIRLGAHDVLALPLDVADLEVSLAAIPSNSALTSAKTPVRTSKLISVIKSSGGAGATALITQLAVRYAEAEAKYAREACLIDLDVQFGDAAFQLGLKPKLSLAELVEARSRLDGALVRSIATEHSSGLKVITSPPQLLPLESLTSTDVIDVVEAAEKEFGTVFLDLPANWTNWSLSLLARSDVVLLVTELSVSGLRRARRQLDLMRSQDLDVDVRVVINRYEKRLLRAIKAADVAKVLGRDFSFTIAEDPAVMRAAIDRGVPIAAIKRKSAVGKDIDTLIAGLTAALRRER